VAAARDGDAEEAGWWQVTGRSAAASRRISMMTARCSCERQWNRANHLGEVRWL
jgi:hypothetical protein